MAFVGEFVAYLSKQKKSAHGGAPTMREGKEHPAEKKTNTKGNRVFGKVKGWFSSKKYNVSTDEDKPHSEDKYQLLESKEKDSSNTGLEELVDYPASDNNKKRASKHKGKRPLSSASSEGYFTGDKLDVPKYRSATDDDFVYSPYVGAEVKDWESTDAIYSQSKCALNLTTIDDDEENYKGLPWIDAYHSNEMEHHYDKKENEPNPYGKGEVEDFTTTCHGQLPGKARLWSQESRKANRPLSLEGAERFLNSSKCHGYIGHGCFSCWDIGEGNHCIPDQTNSCKHETVPYLAMTDKDVSSEDSIGFNWLEQATQSQGTSNAKLEGETSCGQKSTESDLDGTDISCIYNRNSGNPRPNTETRSTTSLEAACQTDPITQTEESSRPTINKIYSKEAVSIDIGPKVTYGVFPKPNAEMNYSERTQSDGNKMRVHSSNGERQFSMVAKPTSVFHIYQSDTVFINTEEHIDKKLCRSDSNLDEKDKVVKGKHAENLTSTLNRDKEKNSTHLVDTSTNDRKESESLVENTASTDTETPVKFQRYQPHMQSRRKTEGRLRVLTERTENLLMVKTANTIKTSACCTIIRKLQIAKVDKYAVLLGDRKSMKTTNGFIILSNLSNEWTPVSLREPNEWEIVAPFINKKKMALFVDDIFEFENTGFDVEKYKMWKPILREIHAAASLGKVVFLVSVGRSAFEKYLEHGYSDDIFDEKHVMDLSKDYCLKYEERLDMITTRVESVRQSLLLMVCKEEANENIQSNESTPADDGSPRIKKWLFIWEGTLKKIAAVDMPCFPWYAANFVKSRRNIRKGIEFFDLPARFIQDELKRYRESCDEGDTAKFLALSDTLESVNKLEQENSEAQTIKTKDTKKKRQSKCSTSILEKSATIKGVRDVQDLVETGKESLRGSCLSMNEAEETCFVAKAYMHATALTLAKDGERDVILNAPKAVIKQLVRVPKAQMKSSDDLRCRIMAKEEESQNALIQRLIEFVLQGDIQSLSGHEAMQNPVFAHRLVTECKRQGILNEIISVKDSQSQETLLVLGLDIPFRKFTKQPTDGPYNFTELLLEMRIQIPTDVEKILLRKCCTLALETTFRRLLKRRARVDEEILLLACRSGSINIVEQILAAKKFPPSVLSEALNASCLVCSEKNRHTTSALCQILQAKGAFFAASNITESIVHTAIRKGNFSLLCLVHEFGADLDVTNRECNTPLHLACSMGRTQCCKFLIENDANLSQKNRKGRAPIHEVARTNRPEIISMLLKKDPSLATQTDAKGRLPIHIAAMYNHRKIIEKLLHHDADVDARIRHSCQTSLHVAIQHLRRETIDLLLQCGANAELKDSEGKKPFTLACENGTYQQVHPIFEKHRYLGLKDTDNLFHAMEANEKELALLLIDKNYCSVNSKNEKGETLLHRAIQKGDLQMVSRLILKGANVNIRSNDVHPLHEAVVQDKTDIFLHLLSSGADIHAKQSVTKNSTLHIACARRRAGIVRIILEGYPYMVEYRNKQGRTALHEAVEAGSVTVVQFLLKDSNKSAFAKGERGKLEKPIDIALRCRNQQNNKHRPDIERVIEYDQIFKMLIK